MISSAQNIRKLEKLRKRQLSQKASHLARVGQTPPNCIASWFLMLSLTSPSGPIAMSLQNCLRLATFLPTIPTRQSSLRRRLSLSHIELCFTEENSLEENPTSATRLA